MHEHRCPVESKTRSRGIRIQASWRKTSRWRGTGPVAWEQPHRHRSISRLLQPRRWCHPVLFVHHLCRRSSIVEALALHVKQRKLSPYRGRPLPHPECQRNDYQQQNDASEPPAPMKRRPGGVVEWRQLGHTLSSGTRRSTNPCASRATTLPNRALQSFIQTACMPAILSKKSPHLPPAP